MLKGLLKTALPATAVEHLKQLRTAVKNSRFTRGAITGQVLFLRLCSLSPRLAATYYALFSGAYDREHSAVLAGRIQYLQDLIEERGNTYLLRRNTHRLEKGLLMQPRRPIFAQDYLEETVECYLAIASGGGGDDEELTWAHHVLTRYFSEVTETAITQRARQRFLSRENAPKVSDDDRTWVPYLRDLSSPPPVQYNELLDLAVRRRSVRFFQQRPVPRRLLDQAMEVATLSPSACNRQPFEYRFFDEQETVRAVLHLAGGTQGYADNVPAVVAIIGQLKAFFSERDRHLIYIDGGLSAMSFCLALESLGLSSCCVNWPDVDSAESSIARLLNLQPHERVVMLLAVGYADPNALVASSRKKPLSMLRSYNRT